MVILRPDRGIQEHDDAEKQKILDCPIKSGNDIVTGRAMTLNWLGNDIELVRQ
jgi:hypothetical protein